MADSSRVTSVAIHGQSYAVRSPLDPEYVRRLAAYVDEKFAELRRQMPGAPEIKLMVFAALLLATSVKAAIAAVNANATPNGRKYFAIHPATPKDK